MIFATFKDILTHISFSIVSIRITIWPISFFLEDEIVQLYDSSKNGIIVIFLCLKGFSSYALGLFKTFPTNQFIGIITLSFVEFLPYSDSSFF